MWKKWQHWKVLINLRTWTLCWKGKAQSRKQKTSQAEKHNKPIQINQTSVFRQKFAFLFKKLESSREDCSDKTGNKIGFCQNFDRIILNNWSLFIFLCQKMKLFEIPSAWNRKTKSFTVHWVYFKNSLFRFPCPFWTKIRHVKKERAKAVNGLFCRSRSEGI